MKFKVFKSINQGFGIIIKNKIILAFSIFYAVIFSYTPEVLKVSEASFNLDIFLFLVVLIFLALILTKLSYDAIKGNISISEAIKLSLKKFIFVIIASIIYLIIGTIGLILLVIPGIFLLNKFIFVTYPILLNNGKIIDSFKESWSITKGNWWRIFSLLILFWVLMVILYIISSLISLGGAVYVALAINFVLALLYALLMTTFTVVYIQLSEGEVTIEKEEEGEEGEK